MGRWAVPSSAPLGPLGAPAPPRAFVPEEPPRAVPWRRRREHPAGAAPRTRRTGPASAPAPSPAARARPSVSPPLSGSYAAAARGESGGHCRNRGADPGGGVAEGGRRAPPRPGAGFPAASAAPAAGARLPGVRVAATAAAAAGRGSRFVPGEPRPGCARARVRAAVTVRAAGRAARAARRRGGGGSPPDGEGGRRRRGHTGRESRRDRLLPFRPRRGVSPGRRLHRRSADSGLGGNPVVSRDQDASPGWV